MTPQIERLAAALADRYAIDRELGAGGMATVYLAEDVRHRRNVAVKVLRPELAAVLGAERFFKEIEIAAGLRHPNILPLYDSGEADGFLYYVMPYEQGQSLRERMDREGPLPIPETIALLREVVEALATAHESGIVHRDIKPDNIMLSGRHALVMDFGIAKAVSQAGGSQQLTTAGVVMGTPSYMSPEQASGDSHIDRRTDIYAVGIMAYEMITGRLPFSGPTMQAVLAAHITKQAEPIAKFRNTVSPELDAAILRCLAKTPADRWQTATDLDAALAAIASTSGASTAVTPSTKKARFPLPAVIGGVVVVAIAIGAFALGSRTDVPNSDVSIDRVAVFPFVVRTGNEQLAYLGEGVAELLATAMDGTGDLRSVDPSTVIRRVADESAPPDLARAEELARHWAAGRFVLGGITDIGGGNIQLRASMYVTGETDPILVQRSGDADQPLVLVRSVTAELLAATIGKTISASAALLTTDSVEALKAYIAGATLYRRGRYRESMEEFERAVEIDPQFAMAYHKLAMAAGWASGAGGGREAAAAALRLADRLPERQRTLLAAAAAYHNGNPMETERNALAVVREDPTEYEAWYLLAESRFHQNTLIGRPISDALEPLMRVHEGDPARGDVYLHLYQLALADRDLGRLEDLDRELARVRGSGESRRTRLARALLDGDSVALDSLRSGSGWSGLGGWSRIWDAGLWEDLPETLRHVETFDPGGGFRGAALVQEYLAMMHEAGGQRQAALAALADVEPTAKDYVLPIKGLLALDAFPAWPDSAIDVVRHELIDWDPESMARCEVPNPLVCILDGMYPVLRLFLVGALELRLGHTATGLAYADSLADYRDPGDAESFTRNSARTLRALAAETAGDHVAALALLDRFEPGQPGGLGFFSVAFGYRGFENQIAARILYASGRDEAALRRYEAGMFAVWGLGRSRLRRGELYERMDEPTLAVAEYDRFLELWQHADEEYLPLVEDVRSRIARLTSEPGTQ